MGRFGAGEVILILVVALLIFGPAKLPQLARSLGESIRSFKESVKGADEEIAEVKKEIEEIKESVTK
ncbi:MAG: twin-arginine translocase TatA/TatE family subunit [Symbiobacterium sp.]|uniref:twin-arginine translocase TatA/TatE family subunit n=1 Tax=Symbiobacterium sp. TaxID=1971213 RepID=UPI0034647C17